MLVIAYHQWRCAVR